MAVRVPNAEEVMAARNKHAVHLAVGFFLVGEEHHAELAQDGIENRIWKRQSSGVGRLKIDLIAGSKLRARYYEHRRVQVSCRQTRVGRQQIPQLAGYDAGPRGDLQDAHRTGRSHATCDVGAEIDEDHRTQAPVILVRDSAYEAHCLSGHHLPFAAAGRGPAYLRCSPPAMKQDSKRSSCTLERMD